MPDVGEQAASEWEAEGGVDVAREFLLRYDTETGIWDFPLLGHIWDAVRQAWSADRYGAGATVAVIDDGFDIDVPRLAEQTAPWGEFTRGQVTHGTVVALTVLAVAPAAHLLLYPVADKHRWRTEWIAEALRDVKSRDAAVVNMSLGKTHEIAAVRRGDDWWRSFIKQWPDYTGDDYPFWWAEQQGRLSDWRQRFDLPPSEIATLTRELAATGRTVMVAAGNSSQNMYEPAAVPGLFAAGFTKGAHPAPKDIFDRIRFAKADFDQSELFDFQVMQPSGALGSSFATPMMSGFATLMRDHRDLATFREANYLAELAAECEAEFTVRDPPMWQPWVKRWTTVIDDLSTRALALPHAHPAPDVTPSGRTCPECFLFSFPTYVSYGQFKLNTGYLDVAEATLLQARAIAPGDASPLLLLGRLWAHRADDAVLDGRHAATVRPMLEQADSLLRQGLGIRPDYARSQALLRDIEPGLQSPRQWRLPETYRGF